MKPSKSMFVAILSAGLATPVWAGQGAWALSGHAGMAVGDQTAVSFAWWGTLQRWMTPAVGLGLEAGRHRWEGGFPEGRNWATGTSPYYPEFEGLARGSNELQHLSGSISFRNWNRHRSSAPVLTLSVGAYRQAIREPDVSDGGRDPRDGVMRPGLSVSVGGAGVRGIAPGAVFRVDLVDTNPRATGYFSCAVGLHLNFDRPRRTYAGRMPEYR